MKILTMWPLLLLFVSGAAALCASGRDCTVNVTASDDCARVTFNTGSSFTLCNATAAPLPPDVTDTGSQCKVLTWAGMDPVAVCGKAVELQDDGLGCLTLAVGDISKTVCNATALAQDISPLTSPHFQSVFLNLAAFGVVSMNSDNSLMATLLEDGEFLMGATGGFPQRATVTGTQHQIIVQTGPNRVTLSTPQSIDTTSSPTFAAATLLDSQLTLGATTVVAAQTHFPETVTIPDPGVNGADFILSRTLSQAGQTIEGVLTLSGIQFDTLQTANGVAWFNGSQVLSSTALTDGQVLVGATGSSPVAAALTGTANQVNVANGAGSVTLSTPQNIHSGASPTFAGLTLSGLTASTVLLSSSGKAVTSQALTNGQLLIGSTGSAPVAATLTGTTNQVNVATGAGTLTLSTPQNIDTAASPSFSGLTLSGLTANTVLVSSSGKSVASQALTDGQLLIGSTGAAPVAATLTGTTNQINVATGAGTLTLSTPQSIATSSTPTFASQTLSASTNQLVLGTTTTTTISATAPASSRTLTIPDSGGAASFILSRALNQAGQTISGVVTLSGVQFDTTATANSVAWFNGSSALLSTALTDGQLLVGSTGAVPVAATITGTANQVNVANAAGSITLSTPQSIATTSSPSFTSISLTSTASQFVIGATGNTTSRGTSTGRFNGNDLTRMYATPLQMLAAPGTGFAYILDTAYLNFVAGSGSLTGTGNIVIQFGNTANGAGTSAINSATAAGASLLTGVNKFTVSVGINSATAAVTTGVTGQGIFLSNTVGAFANAGVGAGTYLTWMLDYMVVPML